MQVAKLDVEPTAALQALREYKQHRDRYDARDWEIERIYRAISKGKTVISVAGSIREAGHFPEGLPKIAFARADSRFCRCSTWHQEVTFAPEFGARFRVKMNAPVSGYSSGRALVPRIPPQYRPAQKDLAKYHILWEADWHAIPRDPYLLRKIAADAYVVVAAWDLTAVEVAVLSANLQR